MRNTKLRLPDLLPAPSHVIGPTWRQLKNGGYWLPEKTLPWQLINWYATWLASPGDSDKPFLPTPEQAHFLAWWYAVDENGTFAYRAGILRRMKGWGKDPLVAALALGELAGPVAFSHFDEDGNPFGKPRSSSWIQIAAVSQDQTQHLHALPGHGHEGVSGRVRHRDQQNDHLLRRRRDDRGRHVEPAFLGRQASDAGHPQRSPVVARSQRRSRDVRCDRG